MKRIKYLLLTIHLAFTFGCQHENTVMIPIEDSVVQNDDIQSGNIENAEPKDTPTDEQEIIENDKDISRKNGDEEDVYA